MLSLKQAFSVFAEVKVSGENWPTTSKNLAAPHCWEGAGPGSIASLGQNWAKFGPTVAHNRVRGLPDAILGQNWPKFGPTVAHNRGRSLPETILGQNWPKFGPVVAQR